MELIFELNNEEDKWWSGVIKEYRNKLVKHPSDYLQSYTKENKVDINVVKRSISNFIHDVREACWNIYIQDELAFHKEVILHLVKTRDLPNSILRGLVDDRLLVDKSLLNDQTKMFDKLSEIVGEFAGRIMPYFYDLSLSTTNSRRSRAGQTFEAIITYIMKLYNYPFEDQSSLGSAFYRTSGLGKMVDGVIPGSEEYEQNRNKCQIITMKTTLRERWQEVVEELNRTNIPHIYLLTLDGNISSNLLNTMKHQNITLVGYDSVKENLKEFDNMISFDDYFNREIPHTLDYWKKIK